MMLSEVAGIVDRQVNLVVVRANHVTAQVVAVGIRQCVEVGIRQVVVVSIVATGRCIHVHTTTIAARHLVDGVGRAIFVSLVGIDALRVGELQLQALQNLAPPEVVVQAGVDAGVRRHVL